MDEAFLRGVFQKFPECSKFYDVQVGRTSIVFCEKLNGTSYQQRPRGFTAISMSDVIGCKIYESKIPKDPSGYFKVNTYRKVNKKGTRSLESYSFRVTDSDDRLENIAIADRWARTISWILHNDKLPIEELQSKVEFPPPRRFLVLINPKSGPGRSVSLFNERLAPLLNEANIQYKSIISTHAGHATEIARDLDLSEYDTVVISSGDGMVHEVINGFMQREDWEVAIKTPIGLFPTGSGNGLAATLMFASGELLGSLSSAAYILLRGGPKPLDLFSLTTMKRKMFGFLGVTWGIMSDVDIESERFRAIGDARFTVGAIERIIGLRTYKGVFSYLPAAEIRSCASSTKDLKNMSASDSGQDSARPADERRRSDVGNRRRDFSDVGEGSGNGSDSQVTDLSVRRKTFDDGRPPAQGKPTGRCFSAVDQAFGRTVASAADSSLEKGLFGPTSQCPALDEAVPENWMTMSGDFVTISVTSVSHIGYDMYAVPNQPLGAGCMSAQIISKGVTRRQLLSTFTDFQKGNHLKNPWVKSPMVSAFRLVPSMDRIGYVAVDGEVVEYGPVQGEVLPSLARIISTHRCHHA